MGSRRISLKISSFSALRSFTAKSVVKELNSANILYSTTRDPFYEPYLTHPRYGVSGFTIYNRILETWFKGDRNSTDWFLSWLFYRTIARRLFKKLFHLSVVLSAIVFIVYYAFFTDSNIFLKIGLSIFGSFAVLIYHGLTSTPIRVFRESIQNFDSGFFNNKNKEIFFDKFFLDLPAACYPLPEFIRLSSVADKNSVEAIESLHEGWHCSSKELLDCVDALTAV